MKYKAVERGYGSSSLQGYVICSYDDLEKLFGQPNDGDSYKVSTEWILKSKEGKYFSIYDYKETNLYCSDGLPVSKFRELKSYEWHIGADNKQDAQEFIKWLTKKLLKMK